MTIKAGDTVFVVIQHSPGGGVSIDGEDTVLGVYRRYGDAVRCAEELTGQDMPDGEDEIQGEPDLFVRISARVIE